MQQQTSFMHLEKLLLVVQNLFQPVKHLTNVSGFVADKFHGEENAI